MKLQVYISETKEIYYQNQILGEYDMHNNFLRYVKINKFIVHKKKKNKERYLCVNINDLEYKTKNYTVKIDLLGKNYKVEG